MFKKIRQLIVRVFRERSGEHDPDFIMIAVIGIIITFGLVMLSSATSAVSYATKHQNIYYFFKHQLFGLVLGLAALFIFSRIDYHIWKKYAMGFLVFSVILLLLVFIPGLSAHYGKARSWINVFGYSLQPSEFVKISFLLYLAAWLESRRGKLGGIQEGLGPFLTVLGAVGVLMMLQPDFGTLFIITVTSLVVYFVGGGSVRHILAILLVGVIALMVMVRVKPYQADRFRCYADPGYSSNEKCYQVNQSLIAVGSGGLWGRGLGNSRQKFMYIPEVSGDSIFPIIAEETGLIWSGGLIMLYLLFFYRGYVVARHAGDNFGKHLAIGIVSWITLQALINIGGMVNFMPMTGVPLPFVSYGGSAMLAALSATGVLINISKHTRMQ
jgi:cell division protein FtsW